MEAYHEHERREGQAGDVSSEPNDLSVSLSDVRNDMWSARERVAPIVRSKEAHGQDDSSVLQDGVGRDGEVLLYVSKG